MNIYVVTGITLFWGLIGVAVPFLIPRGPNKT